MELELEIRSVVIRSIVIKFIDGVGNRTGPLLW